MPRYARLHAPSALVHVIGRFVNRAFLLAGPAERAVVLARLPLALARSDWTLLGYALMSSHIHLALLAGQQPPWRLLKPLHTSIALELNRRKGTLGPVFAERATTVLLPPARAGALLSYLHNNPVRAGVVSQASESDWTSHRAWLGLAAAPRWLDVELGLHLAGFGATQEGRRRFADLVAAQGGSPPDEALSGRGAHGERRRVRAITGLPVELSSPALLPESLRQVLHAGPVVAGPRWNGSLWELLQQAALHSGVAVELVNSRSRRPEVVRARRIALMTGVWLLRRELTEVAAALGLSHQGGSQLLRRRTAELLPTALRIAADLRG